MKFEFGKKIADLFSLGRNLDESFFEELEDILIEGDFGSTNSFKISDEVREQKPKTKEELIDMVKTIIDKQIRPLKIDLVEGKTNVFLILGVNGVGKTTTIAKLATFYKNQGKSVVMAAGDTFRAGAIDQLTIHSERCKCRIVHQAPGSDPGAVIYDALTSGIAKKDDLVLCDTAGRLHNKENLMKELQKINKIITSRIDSNCYHKLLVLDATTGQNIISQVNLFNKAIDIDGLILTKYDSSSKAGALVQAGFPIAFVGTGESYSDLEVFDKNKFLDQLLRL